MSAAYLLINLGVISVPLLFSWHPKWTFAKSWNAFWPACILVLIPFIAWDVWFTDSGFWGFNPDYLLGPALWGLPIEEWLFFICIPYSCVFTYFVLSRNGAQSAPFHKAILWVLLILASVTVLLNGDGMYTLVTGIGAILLIIWLMIQGPTWLPAFFKSLLILIIPFVLTNGILTGIEFWTYPLLNSDPASISDSIVWYNNTENLGIRLLSIPLDDFFYAFLLIGLNITLFEGFRTKIGTLSQS
ncbi:MAG: lycopene cyclase domain-containing protein [Bacteroidetes Order II. Incertae sedis bacterium]|jgi:lycopene cyclase domain-containing protein|nr:lycopene cyclase domain-containing protein [Bacteroidetes Order II. bacterium]MBT4052140.1 lycopene cyclase domain-containing protein [Bacteroidetes Order II. bacterium]MBT4603000.1 lycopene cyclase domain-containing protein [Bacteroidetes Order II. bacterium]MBT5248597.1 lycopene cyclase domain-containing protein [Bacteroidetes Order II. bacterium]MBT6200376.1 lycopene cyclase domain-containing protein [Bacteroidetes Order II. bacterium]